MAILRQLAWIPSPKERQLIGLLNSVIEIWQERPLYGNMAQCAYFRLKNDSWVRLSSESMDVVFKFECISLRISKCKEPCHDSKIKLLTPVDGSNIRLLFRPEWLRPAKGDFTEISWNELISESARLEELPTRQATGCLAWWGILFISETASQYLVHLDDFPLSIRIDSNKSLEGLDYGQCRMMKIDEIEDWVRSIRGWEILECPESNF